ncbi:tRNA 2-selenouridine(34) synthase MnmH [Paenibacillus sp. PK3_47]|uniref:tRNA 2-selenouridine(34) synthase MnmH n=1 Tax=Paenibacillus sp. PK3_47 TaxID=2072642 RepID=UPI00201D5C3E|nr:tRNA 2-selenouridine(34) synthase MnmH [Paenibacillus sp. PK3_47]UQZ36172.1 tRNA 2-selenouridine(34) synthase MnmH [Paenibacillus sp. PK3_47]
MFQDITLEELRALRSRKEITVIDVRSPSEYKDATVPGSLNIPFFNDQERAEVGTLYKQTSVQAAKEKGLDIISAKLPSFIQEFGAVQGEKAVFCWRGGMRSRTTATVLSLMDIHAYRLIGGYKAYRKWVLEELEHYDLKPKPYVIHGNTGTGKTNLLHRLRKQGHPVLDLEGMAGHRGSIFGQIGLQPSNQKTFDSLLLEELIALEQAPYILFEAESKKIGKVVMPQFLASRKETAAQIWIEMPLEARVQQILADYQPEQFKDEYIAAFLSIKSRIHIPVAAEIERTLQADLFGEAVALLLEHYYDPKYGHSAGQYENVEKITFTVNNLDEAEAAVNSYLSEQIPQLQ